MDPWLRGAENTPFLPSQGFLLGDHSGNFDRPLPGFIVLDIGPLQQDGLAKIKEPEGINGKRDHKPDLPKPLAPERRISVDLDLGKDCASHISV